MTDIIFGMCSHYTGAQIEPFLRTCRRHYQNRLVLFTFGCDVSVVEICRKHDVEMVEIQHCKSPVVDRFRFYKQYLDEASHFDNVLLVDVRDVVFQKNPFETELAATEVKFFEEDYFFHNARCNQVWSAGVYGRQEADDMIDNRVLTGGVVLGGSAGIKEFLRIMCHHISQSPNHEFGADQAIINHIFYRNLLKSASSVQNCFGEVQNLLSRDFFRFNKEGVLVNDNDTIPAIIHQYDRFEFLAYYFNAKDTFTFVTPKDVRRLAKLDRSVIASLKHTRKVALQKLRSSALFSAKLFKRVSPSNSSLVH